MKPSCVFQLGENMVYSAMTKLVMVEGSLNCVEIFTGDFLFVFIASSSM